MRSEGLSVEDWSCFAAVILEVAHLPVFSIAAGVFPRCTASGIETMILLVEKEFTGPSYSLSDNNTYSPQEQVCTACTGWTILIGTCSTLTRVVLNETENGKNKAPGPFDLQYPDSGRT